MPSDDFQTKGSDALNKLEIFTIMRDHGGTNGAATERDQDIVEQPLGEFAAKLWNLYKQRRYHHPGFFPDEMGRCDDTPGSLKGFIECSHLSAMSRGTDARQKLLYDNGTAVRMRSAPEV